MLTLAVVIKETQKLEARERLWLGTAEGILIGLFLLIILSAAGIILSVGYESLLSKCLLFTGMSFFWGYISSIVIHWFQTETSSNVIFFSVFWGLLISIFVWFLPKPESPPIDTELNPLTFWENHWEKIEQSSPSNRQQANQF